MTDEQAPEPEQPPLEAAAPPSAGIPWGLAFGLLFALAVAVFAVQNDRDVDIRFLGWEGELPLAVLVIGVAIASIFFDEVVGVVYRRRRRARRAEREELRRLRGGR